MIGKNISHYRILEKLGEGGMGVVYKAEDEKLKRTVALKFLPPDSTRDPDTKRRFIREAQAASSLDHPNICTIFEIDETPDGRLFISMACYEGETLEEVIRRGPLEPGRAAGVGLQVAEALARAHQKGIVHRDIKPANIMLVGGDEVKILDFGVAKLSGKTRHSAAGSAAGTVAYMSPEQARGEEVDQRTDVWSLGAALYEMVTGEQVFKGDYEQAVVYSILNEEADTDILARRVSPRFESVVVKMLEKDPLQRYQSMEEVLEELRGIRSDLEKEQVEHGAKAIAVLPFEDISPEKESDYFSDGLTEELIVNLSRLKDIRVVSRTTSMQYKGTRKDIKMIGRELGVPYIVEGSVRKYGNDLRITAQLIDVDGDRHLWAETYKGELSDVFEFQERVSRQIVDALRVKLTPTEKVALTKRSTLNPEAFDCNLRAREFLYRQTKNSLEFAIQLFEKAIQLDPRYAAAYAGLGETYATLYQQFDRKEVWLDKAIESSLKALMYDATLGEAYAALGLAYFNKKLLEEAEEATRKAIELDPEGFIGYWILGRIYHSTDRDREAAGLFERALELNPDFFSAQSDLHLVYERLGEEEKCAEILQAALEFFPRYLSSHPDDARARMFYGIHLARADKNEEAKREAGKALELNPGDPLMLYNAACFYSRLGESALAVSALKDAVRAGFEYYDWIKRDPDLDGIRDDPGYGELMEGK